MGNKFGAFLAGGLAGAVVALLYAPRSGQETRAMVTDKMSAAWGEAQELGSQAGANMQHAYQDAASKGQEVVQDVAAKGQELYGQATQICCRRVQDPADNIKPAFSQKNDELRDKIEAARQRIASQVAKNAEQAHDAVSDTIPVAADTAHEAVDKAEDKAQSAADAVKDKAEDAADKISGDDK